MNEIRFPWFRTGCVGAAICLTIGASCTLPAPGLMRALMTVETDVQLPLERIATDNRVPARVTDLPEPLDTSASESAHAQSSVHSWQDSSRRADTNVDINTKGRAPLTVS